MYVESQKIIINLGDRKCPNWKLLLKEKSKILNSKNIEIDCKNTDLSCKEILEIIENAKKYNCKIFSFCSTSPRTIVSAQSLGYKSHFLIEKYSQNSLEINNKEFISSCTNFHQGTIRSGEYLDSPGDLLILGDINPGAIVSAEGNIIIWGKLLGIAHAGNKGNTKATISALQLRPVQLRIANLVARGPKEKPQIGFAEKASIDFEKIIISPLDYI